jgi:signal transduction histidine kinase
MANRKQNLEEIFRAQNPLTSDGFQLFLWEVEKEGDSKALRDFFIRLNSELHRALWVENVRRIPWAKDILLALLKADQQLTVMALGDLLEEMKLHYQDPLTEVTFETSSGAPPLLSLLGDIVQKESQLLQLRVRALEALFTKLSLGRKPLWVGTEAESTLRVLNEILDALKQESIKEMTKQYEHLSKNIEAVNRLLSDPTRSRHVVPSKPNRIDEEDSSLEGYRNILELVQVALKQLASGPTTPDCISTILKILKANTPLPSWHPSTFPLVAHMHWTSRNLEKKVPGGYADRSNELPSDPDLADTRRAEPPRFDSPGEDSKIILTLIIDRAIAIVLEIAVAGWRPEMDHQIKPRPWREGSLSPSDPTSLGSVLLDQKSPPKIRSMAAALLGVLSYGLPSVRLSPRVEFYCDLFLMPHRAGGVHYRLYDGEGVCVFDIEEKIAFLFEAFDEESDYVRWNASTLCYRSARDHPEWFKPKHFVKLLFLLSDEHYGIRLDMMRTIRVLASFRNQEIATVIHDFSGKLAEKVYRAKDNERARIDLEAASGVGLASLLERADELQEEVLRLESMREHLLSYLERQALRIGEEIHHDVLNTLCGYLATAIDERDYAAAQSCLTDVVTELRKIMNRLYPKDLEAEGFLATIRKRLEDTKTQMQRRTTKSFVDFDCPGEITDEIITESLRDKSHLVLLYRIVLEAMINARKHAQSTFIGVRLRRPRPGFIEISVSDNGRGNGGPFEESVGIDLMRRRAEDVGAEIEFRKTSSTGGTTVVIRLSDESRVRVSNRSKVSGAI